MAMVMIKCPHTGAALATGIEIDEFTFAHLPEVKAYAFCPRCGRDHAWWRAKRLARRMHGRAAARRAGDELAYGVSGTDPVGAAASLP